MNAIDVWPDVIGMSARNLPTRVHHAEVMTSLPFHFTWKSVPTRGRMIGLAWHRDRYRPPCAVAFAELAQELCAELAADLAPA
ncbi:MAG: hypothetical protein JOY72_10805 [Actinobacteria bacterium]|nr:hypothetical protein [Actinomycetota bacterium]